jgi:hypothetical protein
MRCEGGRIITTGSQALVSPPLGSIWESLSEEHEEETGTARGWLGEKRMLLPRPLPTTTTTHTSPPTHFIQVLSANRSMPDSPPPSRS